jgi:hypothetical protein
MERTTDRIKTIIQLDKEIDDCESTSAAKASELKWKVAEKIWEEWRDGTNNIDLAKAINKSTMHVYRMRRCWEVNLKVHDKPFFNDVYNSDEVRKPPAKRIVHKSADNIVTPAEFSRIETNLRIESAVETLALLIEFTRELERDGEIAEISQPLEAVFTKLEKYRNQPHQSTGRENETAKNVIDLPSL